MPLKRGRGSLQKFQAVFSPVAAEADGRVLGLVKSRRDLERGWVVWAGGTLYGYAGPVPRERLGGWL